MKLQEILLQYHERNYLKYFSEGEMFFTFLLLIVERDNNLWKNNI